MSVCRRDHGAPGFSPLTTAAFTAPPALIGRARAFLDRLAGRPEDGLIAVFTHGLFVKAVMWSLLTGVSNDPTAMRRVRVVGGGTTHLAHSD